MLLLAGLAAAGPTRGQPTLDCAHPAEARSWIGRLRLAEIEGAEDIHRAAMWDAFGRCPAGAAGEPCREAERRRFDAQWEEQKRGIEDKYRGVLGEFEQRCRGLIALG
ncbi:MAG TPA: hypothetical protein VIG37_13460 [Methylomirabilota bacterium]